LDWYLFTRINGLTGRWPPLDGAARAFAQYGLALLAIPLAAAWFGRSDDRVGRAARAARAARADVIRAAIAGLLALGVNQVIGTAWFRPRPFVGRQVHLLLPPTWDASFPSDHSTAAWSVTGSLGHAPAWARWFAAVVSLLVMLARVYAGLHYPLDVLGGAMIGLAVSALVRWAWRLVPRGFERWLERLP